LPLRYRRLLPLTAALAVTLGLARTAATQPAAAPPGDPFESELRAFEKADRILGQKHARVVFIGSSSIRLWEGLGFDFPAYHVVNRGFGGSQIADSVRNAERILAAHKPPLVVMYAGSNDIDAGKSPAAVAADFKAFTAKVWSLLPDTAIAFISIAPNPARWAQVDRVREANRLIAATCAADKRLTFIDVFPKMLGADGHPRPELYAPDGLHMTRKGYLVWIPLVRNVLNAVVPSEK
jgi:lysophospholipase L1-like esterase